MSNNKDTAIHEVARKIEREKAIINAANHLRQATNNPAVNSRADSQIRDARRNIQYFEQTLRDLHSQNVGGDMAGLSISGGRQPPRSGPASTGRGMNNQLGHGGQADYGNPGPGGYSMGGGNGLMPPRAPYAPPGPQDRTAQRRPNYSKLGEWPVVSEASERTTRD